MNQKFSPRTIPLLLVLLILIGLVIFIAHSTKKKEIQKVHQTVQTHSMPDAYYMYCIREGMDISRVHDSIERNSPYTLITDYDGQMMVGSVIDGTLDHLEEIRCDEWHKAYEEGRKRDIKDSILQARIDNFKKPCK